MVEPFERTLFSLKIAEISPIIQTAYGFHIVQVQEIEPAKTKTFDTVIADIKQKVVQREIEAFKAKLVKEHPAKVHAEVLRSLQ